MATFDKDMKYKLGEIIDRYRQSIENKHEKENPLKDWWDDNGGHIRHFRDYIHRVDEFFKKNGCETRTCRFHEKSYYPRKGSWKFYPERTRGLIWLQYDEDRWRCKRDSAERYWVGIPKKLALQILETDKFPVGGITTKCEYCDYEYESTDEFVKHLNAKHFRCAFCSRVFDCKENQKGAVCDKCLEKHNNESQ